MPTIKVNGAELFYTEQGNGGQTLVFGHGLLMDCSMWDLVASKFNDGYRVICFDFRGQGKSEDPGFGYDIDTLVEDTVALIQSVSTGPVHYVGLSMGGMVGLPLAARHPKLLRSLVLLDTSAQAEPWTKKIRYRMMNWFVKLFGVKPLVPGLMPLMFGKSFLKDAGNADYIGRLKTRLSAMSPRILGPTNGVTRRRDITVELSKIFCPCLVVVGEKDITTPLSCAHHLVAHIPDAKLEIISDCGHTSALEKPDQVIGLMKKFYSGLV